MYDELLVVFLELLSKLDSKIKESDAEILCNIIRSYIGEKGLYPDIHSLAHGHGMNDYLDIRYARNNDHVCLRALRK